jgi:hypothetical protein
MVSDFSRILAIVFWSQNSREGRNLMRWVESTDVCQVVLTVISLAQDGEFNDYVELKGSEDSEDFNDGESITLCVARDTLRLRQTVLLKLQVIDED